MVSPLFSPPIWQEATVHVTETALQVLQVYLQWLNDAAVVLALVVAVALTQLLRQEYRAERVERVSPGAS